MPIWDADNLSAPHTQRELGDEDAALDWLVEDAKSLLEEVKAMRDAGDGAERLYREARALWWATLLLAGVTLAVVVVAAVWGAQ